MMNAATTSFRGEDGVPAGQMRAALARLITLAPRVFPAVAVADDWNAALAQARDVLTPMKKEQGYEQPPEE